MLVMGAISNRCEFRWMYAPAHSAYTAGAVTFKRNVIVGSVMVGTITARIFLRAVERLNVDPFVLLSHTFFYQC